MLAVTGLRENAKQLFREGKMLNNYKTR